MMNEVINRSIIAELSDYRIEKTGGLFHHAKHGCKCNLNNLFAESRELEKEIMANLNKLGYEG